MYEDIFLDPDADTPDDPPKKKKHAAAFIDGITPKTAAELDNHMKGNVRKQGYVKYDSPTRYVALYDVPAPDGTSWPTLRIGLQVKDTPVATDIDDNFGTPNMKLPHYHQVWTKKDGPTYHVATAM